MPAAVVRHRVPLEFLVRRHDLYERSDAFSNADVFKDRHHDAGFKKRNSRGLGES